MSIAEIKEEIKLMQATELDEVAALILQLRRARDPDRKERIAELIDGDDWIQWHTDHED